ncbi:hypothetical protein L208DRAFT_1311956, partial [Tricholoma matsutake]
VVFKGPVWSGFRLPNGATGNRNRSRTDPDIGGLQLDPLGPVLIGPWTEKRLVWTGLLSFDVAMTETELHLLKMRAKWNVTTISYVRHILH